MELQYLLSNMEATAVVGYVELERSAGYGVEHTYHAYNTDGEHIFRRKGQTAFQKVANGKGMRVMALGYFGVASESQRRGLTAPEYMRAKEAQRLERVS